MPEQPSDAAVDGHAHEPHDGAVGDRLNWLRAGVLGANDGLVSTAGIVVGVAAATTSSSTILTAAVAGLVAGAVSMALGEYVSVSTQRDTERALIAKEKAELRELPDAERRELEGLYRAKGLTADTARRVAAELSAHDPLTAHLDIELGIKQDELTRPALAAASSALSFTLGAALPVLAALIEPYRIVWIVVATLVGLAITGYLSARLGGAGTRRATTRVLLGGVLAMAITYAVGSLVGAAALG